VDEETPQFYRSHAQAYAGREKSKHARLIRFLALLPAGGLGHVQNSCGGAKSVNSSDFSISKGIVLPGTVRSPPFEPSNPR
jgi:hypothetical protein